MADNIYSAYHYACKTKADREVVEQMKADTLEAAQKAVWGNIGDIKYTTRTTAPNGGVWCDGGTYDKSSFETVYQMLVDGKLQAVTMDVYDSTVSTNKSCGFFGLDTVNEVFKVPTLTDVYLKAGQAAQTFGAESLPQHTHTGTVALQGTFDNYNTGYYNQFAGADYSSGRGTGTLKTGGASSGVYKDNAKVNPDHVKYRAYIILCTVVKDVSIGDYTNILANATREGVDTLNAKTLSGISDLANASNALRTTQITNCITEIPQDIKLELKDGVLTLKAGSKVYVPNRFEEDGVTPKFDVVVVESDKTISDTTTNVSARMLFLDATSGSFRYLSLSSTSSGTTQPSGNWIAWYDTNEHLIKHTNSTGEWQSSYFSLPLGIIFSTGTVVAGSIDQVFNGFGYIGSTVFALPNVKGLIPNGRNADGSLRNIEFTTNKVNTTNYKPSTSHTVRSALTTNGIKSNGAYRYDTEENYVYDGSSKTSECVFAITTHTPTGITSFNPKLPFRAVDCNDIDTLSIQSNSPNYSAIIGLSAGAFTPSVDGYFLANPTTRTDGTYWFLHLGSNDSGRIIGGWWGQGYNQPVHMMIRVNKGEKYYSRGSYASFYFIPLKGAK